MSDSKSIYTADPGSDHVDVAHSACSQSHLQLPWDRFYWSVIETPQAQHPTRLRSTATRATLDDRFQSEIPLAIEQIATSYAAGDSAAIIACGFEVDQLRQEQQAHPGLLTLTPESLPPRLQSRFSDFDLARLNLLVADHEPQPLRLLRTKTRRTALVVAAAVLALATLGILRRTSDTHQQLSWLGGSIGTAMSEVTGSKKDREVSLRLLEQERDRLASTRTMQAVRGLPMDASRSLAAVLSAWPKDLEIKTQTIAASSQGVTVAAELNDQSGAETLSKALAAVPGWILQSPRTHSTGKAVRFDASLQPTGGVR